MAEKKIPALEDQHALKHGPKLGEPTSDVEPALKVEPDLNVKPAMKREHVLVGEPLLKYEMEIKPVLTHDSALDIQSSVKSESVLSIRPILKPKSVLKREPAAETGSVMKSEPGEKAEPLYNREPNLDAGPSWRTPGIELANELKLMCDRALDSVNELTNFFESEDDVNNLRGQLKYILSEIRSKTEILDAYKEYERIVEEHFSESDSSDGSDSSDESEYLEYNPDLDDDPSILKEHRTRLTSILGKLTSKVCAKLKSRRIRSEEENPERCEKLRQFINKLIDGTATLEEFYRI